MSKAPLQDKLESRVPAAKTKVERVHGYLGVISTFLGIAGAAGTGLVWLIANFYTGTVEITGDNVNEPLEVKVFDLKGNESTFHSRTFQLMPGQYYLDVVLPDLKVKHFDVVVAFRETARIEVRSVREDKHQKRRWWQFWRQKNTSDKDEEAPDRREAPGNGKESSSDVGGGQAIIEQKNN